MFSVNDPFTSPQGLLDAMWQTAAYWFMVR